MPSWKKVIISGSAAELSSLYAPSITGSLQGTASWAVSASHALTASYSKNLVISGSVNNVDYIDFNTGSATPVYRNGRIFWDNTEGALSVYNSEADITLQVGQENWTRVWNPTAATITNGTPVRITGTHGDHPEIVLAQSLLVSGSVNLVNQILGLATHDIEPNTFGYITTQGLVRGVNTSAFNDGDTLYVGATAGQLINTALRAPYEIIPIGQVVKAGPGGSGIIYVAVQQPLDFSDLSSVLVTGSYSYGDILTYIRSGSTGVWTHTNQLSGSYGLTGSLTVTGSTTTDLVRITQTGTGNAFVVEDSNNPDVTPFLIDATGNTMIGTTSSLGPLTVRGAGAIGVTLETDSTANQENQSTRLFFKVSGSGRDISIRNFSGSFVFGTRGTSGASSGTQVMVISASGDTGIGSGFSPSANRAATLQVSGNISIESGDAYKQDGSNVIYIAKGTEPAYYNIIGGAEAGTSGSTRQTAYGYAAGASQSGSFQTAIGNQAGRYNTGSNATQVGYIAGQYNSSSNQTAVGYAAGRLNSGSDQTAVGYFAGYLNLSSFQTAVGTQAGQQNSGSNQTAVGYAAGLSNYGSNQTTVGYFAGYQNSGSNQTAVGVNAGYQNSGSNQTAIGRDAGYKNSGANQTVVGLQAGLYNTGSNQTAVGVNAGNQNAGNDNTNIGYQAGLYTTGTTNNTGSNQSVFLGSTTYAGGANRTNQIVIGYNASGIGSNSVVLGNDSILTTALKGFVGIGTTTPTASLHVNNTTTSASFLVEDSTNPDTTPFIVDSTGNVGIGTTTPSTKLHVSGNAGAVNWVSTDHIYHQFYPQGISAGRFAYFGFPSSGSTSLSIFNETVNGNISLGTNSTARLNISPSGNIGIGVLVPTAKFEIKSSAANNLGGLLLRASGSSNTTALIYETTNEAGVLELYSGSALTTRLYANGYSYFNGGNVGIGTITPTAKLHINHTGSGNSFLVEDSTNPDTTPFVIDTNGNVGIGTTTPSHKLHLYNTAYTLLLLERSGSLNAPIQYTNAAGTFYAGLSSSGSFAIGNNPDLINPSTFLTVSASGNVGIGTTTPTYKLDVLGNARLKDVSAELTIDSATWSELKYGADNYFRAQGDQAIVAGPLIRLFNGSEETLRVTGSNVSIGTTVTSPTARLHINNTSSANSFLVEDDSNVDVSPFVIDNSGKVGIGLDNPSSPLHVRNIAIPGDSEIIAQFDVSDDSSYFRIRNATGANSTFIPTLQGYNSSDKIAMYFLADGVTDTGTDPLLNHDVRINNAEVVTRPLYRWSNFGNIKMIMLANGNLGIGTETPLANLHTTGSAIISGSMVIGSSSLGPNENTLTLGARDTSAEGGQIGFNAPGGTYTSASFIDLYQNRLRILKGTNATSTGEVANWNMHNLQMALPAYTSNASFPGTAAGYLGFDSSGNVITLAAGNPFPYTGNAVITGSLIISASGTTNDLQVGTNKLFVSASGNIGIGITTPSASLHINNIATNNSFLVEDSTNPDATPFVIDAAGNVGIGTTSPQYLFVASSSTSTDTIMFFDGGASANSNLVAAADTSIKVPFLVLSDRTNSYTPSTSYFLGLDRSSTPNYASRNDAIYVNNYQDKGHYFVTNNGGSKAVRMVISGSGNVGIGTTTPNARLDVNGSALITGSLGVTGSLFVTGSTTTDLVRITQAGSGNAFAVYDINSDTTPFVINSSGSVGIGTPTPSSFTSRLMVLADLNGTSGIRAAGAGNHAIIGNAGTNYAGIYGEGVGDDAGEYFGGYFKAYQADTPINTNTYIGAKFEASSDATNYSVQLKDGTQAAGKVLVSQDASGSANWSTQLTGSYGITGSLTVTGSIYGTELISTTNQFGDITNVTPALVSVESNDGASAILQKVAYTNTTGIDYTPVVTKYYPRDVSYTARGSNSLSYNQLIAGNVLNAREHWGYDGNQYGIGFHEYTMALDTWTNASHPTVWRLQVTPSGSDTLVQRMEIDETGGLNIDSTQIALNGPTYISDTLNVTGQTNITGNTVITGSLTVSGSYNSPAGNTIDSNAMIQASLLYLSNNF